MLHSQLNKYYYAKRTFMPLDNYGLNIFFHQNATDSQSLIKTEGRTRNRFVSVTEILSHKSFVSSNYR